MHVHEDGTTPSLGPAHNGVVPTEGSTADEDAEFPSSNSDVQSKGVSCARHEYMACKPKGQWFLWEDVPEGNGSREALPRSEVR